MDRWKGRQKWEEAEGMEKGGGREMREDQRKKGAKKKVGRGRNDRQSDRVAG